MHHIMGTAKSAVKTSIAAATPEPMYTRLEVELQGSSLSSFFDEIAVRGIEFLVSKGNCHRTNYSQCLSMYISS